MNNFELLNKLKELKIEDSIWIIYMGIIALSWYSNDLERNFFVNKDSNSKNQYRSINIIVFSILVVVYIYFLKGSFDGINSIKPTDSNKKKELTYLSFMGTLLITISGLIFLYIAIIDNDIDVEIAFN